MKIAVVGAGALGLYFGALLQRAGHELHFLLRTDYDAISKNGLRVVSKNGDFSLPRVNGYRDSTDIEHVDLVIIGLKTTANHKMVELVSPLINDHVAILTLQNGIGSEEILANAFGPDRILGGTAILCSNRIKSGVVHHLDYGSITIGSYMGGHQQLLISLAELFTKAGIPTEITEKLSKIRWKKLVWNIAFNGMCACTNKTTEQLLSDRDMVEELRQLMLEVTDAMNANMEGEKPVTESFVDEMITLTQKMVDYRPSMMIDREEGRPLELEAIYRIPLERAAKHGVSMPRASLLYQILRCC